MGVRSCSVEVGHFLREKDENLEEFMAAAGDRVF